MSPDCAIQFLRNLGEVNARVIEYFSSCSSKYPFVFHWIIVHVFIVLLKGYTCMIQSLYWLGNRNSQSSLFISKYMSCLNNSYRQTRIVLKIHRSVFYGTPGIGSRLFSITHSSIRGKVNLEFGPCAHFWVYLHAFSEMKLKRRKDKTKVS